MDIRISLRHICRVNQSLNKVTLEALELPNVERLSLAHTLLESVEPPSSSEVGNAWDQLIQRRITEIDSGEVEGVPWEQVKSEADGRLAG